jgi:ergothioneine biosynthesis protein EgtB
MSGPEAARPAERVSRENLAAAFLAARHASEGICEPLAIDDFQVQSVTETSPPKWHLAHVTWFFETFVLSHYDPDYRPFSPAFAYLFNSYYETVGAMHPRPRRGLLSRPAVEEIRRYRAHVDEQVVALIHDVPESLFSDLAFRIDLGINHEQQHQELLYMDIKHNFSVNPLRPAYLADLPEPAGESPELRWVERPGGIREIGHAGGGFAFDNETPRHRALLGEHRLASRLVTNGEFLAFLEDGGYTRPELWLADGWAHVNNNDWRCPLYWEKEDDGWCQFTLGGLRPLNPHEPVCHVSLYEADAYARWAGKRLPAETELETVLAERPVAGNFADRGLLQPAPGDGQWYGDLWEWTATPYGPYPGFRPLDGSMGEYNGKFMCNQMTLRGGSCATPAGHVRATYRNFFYPRDRWAFTGIRLAEDA